jgi:hypothetical protein
VGAQASRSTSEESEEDGIISKTREREGIYLEITDPAGEYFDLVLLASAKLEEELDPNHHQHRSYHKRI